MCTKENIYIPRFLSSFTALIGILNVVILLFLKKGLQLAIISYPSIIGLKHEQNLHIPDNDVIVDMWG